MFQRDLVCYVAGPWYEDVCHLVGSSLCCLSCFSRTRKSSSTPTSIFILLKVICRRVQASIEASADQQPTSVYVGALCGRDGL